jgi:sugar/nucleoside kinase (ribokinase family)
VHVGSYWLQTALQPDLPGLFRRARQHGATTSLDTNWDPSGRWTGLDALLAETDILLPNEAEACGIAGTGTWQEALEQLGVLVPTVAIKRGGAGAVAVRGSERAGVAAPAVQVVDAVGAGDSFDAGFVCGALAGWPLEGCLRLAVVCGALSTRAAGGTAAQPTMPEALTHLEG